MPKYIKAVDAADKFSEISGTPLCELVDIMCAIHAADVAQVVRCKDCTYFTDKGVCTFYSVFKNDGSYLSMQFMDDDDFCSCGERKDGDSNDK